MFLQHHSSLPGSGWHLQSGSTLHCPGDRETSTRLSPPSWRKQTHSLSTQLSQPTRSCEPAVSILLLRGVRLQSLHHPWAETMHLDHIKGTLRDASSLCQLCPRAPLHSLAPKFYCLFLSLLTAHTVRLRESSIGSTTSTCMFKK